jgi:Fe-S-cluster-containing hydrogenase component 2
MCEKFPEVRERLLRRATNADMPALIPLGMLGEYVNQGLFQGQKMLALDLVSCTRCDECTRACADSHPDGHARLLREGLRFGDFLVATSCRSCHTPYCMDGCPVDAIHRKGDHLEVTIENHCIGCGLCERNCPYGAIQMVPRGALRGGDSLTVAARRAVNCDLCDGGEPYCVQACPHDAAFRWDGPTLLNEVVARANREGML